MWCDFFKCPVFEKISLRAGLGWPGLDLSLSPNPCLANQNEFRSQGEKVSNEKDMLMAFGDTIFDGASMLSGRSECLRHGS